MNCSNARELLSAYYDGELSTEATATIRDHLVGCDACVQELAGFARLSQLAAGQAALSPPACLWATLEQQLTAPAASLPRRAFWMRGMRPILALAAAILAAVGLGWLGFHGSHRASDEAQFASVFGQYLETFQKSPADAQRILLAKYQGQAIDVRNAVRYVGYTPAVANGLPAGYTLDSVHVWNMPCCTCVQSLCKRKDGTTVAIFEHDNSQLDWFGCRETNTADCDGQRCTLAQLDNQLAATWQLGQRHITVIGARDGAEVGTLAARFAATSAKTSANL